MTDDREKRQRERESVIGKIRALLSKTVANGATEAEAIAAAAKAAEMMTKYDLSMDEVDVRDSGTRRKSYSLDPEFRNHVVTVAVAIAEMTGTRFWLDGPRSISRAGVFFGLPHDVEIACYLLDVCESAMRRETEAFERTIALFRRTIRSARRDAFLTGMSRRISERIRELAWTRRSTANALVPVKEELIKKAMEDEGINLLKDRLGKRDLDPHAFQQGVDAGERVQIVPGVGDEAPLGTIE